MKFVTLSELVLVWIGLMIWTQSRLVTGARCIVQRRSRNVQVRLKGCRQRLMLWHCGISRALVSIDKVGRVPIWHSPSFDRCSASVMRWWPRQVGLLVIWPNRRRWRIFDHNDLLWPPISTEWGPFMFTKAFTMIRIRTPCIRCVGRMTGIPL